MEFNERETTHSPTGSLVDKSGKDFVWQINTSLDILGYNPSFAKWLQQEKGREMPGNFEELPLGELRFRYFSDLFQKAFAEHLTFKYIPQEYSITTTGAHLHFQKLRSLENNQDLMVCTYTVTTSINDDGFYSSLQQKVDASSVNDKTWFWTVDNRFRITYLSNNAETITGYKNEERIGNHVFAKKNQTEQDQLGNAWSDFVKNPRPFNDLVTTMASKDGKMLTLKASGVPQFTDKGDLIGFSGSVTDISEEIEIRNQLFKSEAQQRAILEALPDMFFIFSREGIIIDYHYKEDDDKLGNPLDFIGKSIYDIWPQKQANFLAAPIHRVIETGRVITLNLALKDQRGNEQYFEVRYALVNAQEPHILALMRNVSASKEAQDHLVKTLNDLHFSNRELEQFAYTVSHDLQEPMQLVSNYLQLIKMRSGKQMDDKSLQYIEEAQQSSDRMKNLVTNLLEYSRLGKQKLDLKEIKFDELIESVLSIFNKKIQEKNAKVEVKEVPNFVGDPLHVSLLLQNLIGNAIKFSKPDVDPIIEVSGRDDDDFVQVCIQDNGVGMESSKANEVFGIFQRLSDTQHIEGHGLGMSICRKIVINHGGDIWVESVPQVGTKVYFNMPKSVDQVPIYE